MKFRFIEGFKAMVECGSVSAAARSLKISQPAMTKLLAQLQEDLQMVLFERQSGRLVPTPEAMSLIGSVDRAWRSVIDLQEAARDVRDMRRGGLTVVAFPSLAQTVLPEFIAEFSRDADKTTIALHSQPSLRAIEWAADGLADLGIAVVRSPRRGVNLEPLGRLEAVCALPAGHRLASRKVIRAEDLRGEVFVSLSDGDFSRSRVEAAFRPGSVERDMRLSTPQSILALALVANGAGVSVVDTAAALVADPARVAIRKFMPTVHFDVYMYHPANRVPSQVHERFVRSFRTWFKTRFPASSEARSRPARLQQ
jgi:DNA-binding transcriptional LysR family regulator